MELALLALPVPGPHATPGAVHAPATTAAAATHGTSSFSGRVALVAHPTRGEVVELALGAGPVPGAHVTHAPAAATHASAGTKRVPIFRGPTLEAGSARGEVGELAAGAVPIPGLDVGTAGVAIAAPRVVVVTIVPSSLALTLTSPIVSIFSVLH